MERELSNPDIPVDFELADIAAILRINESQQQIPEPVKRERQLNARNKRRRCACGKCRSCIDNARWESVYQEKFADPFYYSLRHPKQGSALTGF